MMRASRLYEIYYWPSPARSTSYDRSLLTLLGPLPSTADTALWKYVYSDRAGVQYAYINQRLGIYMEWASRGRAMHTRADLQQPGQAMQTPPATAYICSARAFLLMDHD